MKNTWKHWAAGLAIVALYVVVVSAGLAMVGCGGLRLAPREPQRQTRDAAYRLAQAIDQRGTPPGSIASGLLVRTTLEATLDAGKPDEPSDLMALLPAGEARAWETRERQILALKQKGAILLQGFRDTFARLIAQGRAAAVQAAEAALLRASDITVPDDPTLTDAEKQAADQVAAAIVATAAQADADAARRPDGLDVADTIVTEAEWWKELLIPILAGLGVGVPAVVGLTIKKGRQVVDALQERDSAKRSGEQIVLQNQAFMDSTAGQATVAIGGEAVTIADVLKGYLSAQTAETRAFVDEAKSVPSADGAPTR